MFAKLFKTVLRDCRGATAVEYGLVVALIVIVMIAGLANMAGSTGGLWSDVSDKVQRAG